MRLPLNLEDYFELFKYKIKLNKQLYGIKFRLIKHTEQLLEEKEDKLCVKVLKTLQEMMAIDLDYGEKVSSYCNKMYS